MAEGVSHREGKEKSIDKKRERGILPLLS